MDTKDKRGANFTSSETDLLIDIAVKYKDIIENKKTDATTWKGKNLAWIRISNEFNASSGNSPRSPKTIRGKYGSIKKNIRKKCSLLKGERIKTGGGLACPNPLTENEEKIVSLTRHTMVGLECKHDIDAVENIAEPEVDEKSPIEYLEDADYDILRYLENARELEAASPVSTTSECSFESFKIAPGIKIGDDYSVEIEARKGTKKFISANQRAKPAKQSSRLLKENVPLEDELLQLKKTYLLQEMSEKLQINQLTIGNLKLDAAIKKLQIKKLEGDIAGKKKILQLKKTYLLQEMAEKLQINQTIIENLKLDATIKKLQIKKLEGDTAGKKKINDIHM